MRMPYLARVCTLLCLFLVTRPSDAQEFKVRYLGIEDGLSNNAVNTIYQDPKGFMWFGTYDGLNRFDGYDFRTYRNIIGDSTSISSNNINALDGDALHRIWVGGQKGLSIFHPATNLFTHPTYLPHQGKTAVRLTDNILAVQAVKGLGMLVGTQSNGLFQFSDHQQGRQIALNLPEGKRLNYHVTSIAHDSIKGILYVFVEDIGLCVLDPKKGGLQIRTNQVPHANCLKMTRDGRLWLGNNQGLYPYLERENRFSESFIAYKGPVVSLCEDRKGRLWIATDGAGAWLLAPGEKMAAPLRDRTAGNASLTNSNSVYALYEDKEERKWIGTLRGGINIIEPETPFAHVRFKPAVPGSVVDNFIFSFCEDAPDKIWIGTDGAGLRYWDRARDTYQTFTHNEKVPGSLSSNFITGITRDAGGQVWISTWFGGINRFNRKTGSFVPYRCFNSRSREDNNNVWCLLADRKQRLWAAAVRGGALYRYNGKTDRFEEFDNTLTELQALAEDRKGNIWAGDYTRLIRVDTVHKKHRTYHVGSTVRSIYEDRSGNLWVGTQEGGLLLFDPETGRFRQFTTKEGLSSNTVLRILEDELGNLWFSTYNGLSKFDPATKVCKNFYQSDGLQSNQFSFNAAIKLSNGALLFGGIKGFNLFYPERIDTVLAYPPIHLSGLRVNNRPIQENESFIRETNFGEAVQVVVPYDKALLTLDYLGLDYTQAANISYAYRLKGWDKQWNYVNSTRTASYSRLQEGSYVFEVMVSNKKGGWSTAQTLLHITVLPPWYRTWWAYGLYCLAVFLVLYQYSLYRNRQTKLRYAVQLANLERQKEKELNEKKIAFFTNVSHEFRTPLSLIINPIKDLLQKTKQVEETAELRIVYRNAKRLLRLVDQLLLFKKAEQDPDQLYLGRHAWNELCRDVFLCFVEQARTRKIRYEWEGAKNNPLIDADREKIEIVLFNLLSNAFKFTPEGGTVLVQLSETDTQVTVRVSDTGPGIPEEESKKLFERFVQLKHTGNKGGFGIGLYLVKTFVEAHGGTVAFESEVGRGTAFQVSLNKVKELTRSEPVPLIARPGEKVPGSAAPDGRPSEQSPLVPPAPVSVILEEMSEDAAEGEEALPVPEIPGELATEKGTVLIVDDDREMRSYLAEVFASQYQVIQADNGTEGIRLAKHYLPELILSDIVMEGETGLDLCQAIKQDVALSHIPVVLLTGTSADEMQLMGMQSGADDYIKKPFDKEILIARVSALLKRRNILQHYFYNEVTLGSARFKVSVEYREFLERCMQIVEQHILDDDFSIKVLAAEIGMSHSNLYKKIRAVSGQSVSSFIRFVRLKKAAELLISTEMNVNETATMVGIGNVKYFRTQFHQQFGLNPSEYLKKYRKPFHNNQTLDKKLIR